MKYLLLLILSACVSSDVNKIAERERNCRELCYPFKVKGIKPHCACKMDFVDEK